MKKIFTILLTFIMIFSFGAVFAFATESEASEIKPFVIQTPCVVDRDAKVATVTCVFTNLTDENCSFEEFTEGCLVNAKQEGNSSNLMIKEPNSGVQGNQIAKGKSIELVYGIALYNAEKSFTITFTFNNGTTFSEKFYNDVYQKGNIVFTPEKTTTEKVNEPEKTTKVEETTTEKTNKLEETTKVEKITKVEEITKINETIKVNETTVIEKITKTPSKDIDVEIPNTGSNEVTLALVIVTLIANIGILILKIIEIKKRK